MSGGWIHSFAVTDTQTHKNGYTIYKITSIVFPRAIPQALTCITVWKRFHDIKKLHREMTKRQKSFKILGKMPEPTDSTYFKRFDSNIIQRRKEFILEFLDFVAQHPQLYKCHVFFQFFNDFSNSNPNESPLHKLHVEKSRNLHLAEQINLCPLSDDSECTKENNNSHTVKNQSHMETTVSRFEEELLLEKPKIVKENVDLNEAAIENEDKKPTKDYTRFLTPMASFESEDSDYIYEAALEFSHAVQAEANLEYSEAHMRYKRGVELLLNGSKYDSNEERKFIAKTKITKYLARADDIYEKFLSDSSELHVADKTNERGGKLNVQLSIEGVENLSSSYYIERPLNQLAKYKVIKILGDRVIQVQCVTERQRTTYVIKGIEKPSSNAPTQTIFLPQHIPYMVELLAFFQSDQKIYLLLKSAGGGRLVDCMKNYYPNAIKHHHHPSDYECIFPKVDSCSEQNSDESIGENGDHEDLIRSSQRLLKSVTKTLQKNEEEEEPEREVFENLNETPKSLKLNYIPEESLKQWTRELFVAIESLHEKGVILGDLHMHNLLLGDKGQLLLTYFYQNQTITEESRSFYAQSEHFVAPERPLSFKSDWWSFGVILYQLLLGLSFKIMHPGRIDIYGFVQYPENVEISASARDLLDNLLQQSPENRFDATNIREHEFFKGTNWEEVYRNGLNNTP